jgi:hypothetical protein
LNAWYINDFYSHRDSLPLASSIDRKITIKRALRNAKARTNLLHGAHAGLIELKRHRKRLGVDRFAPPTSPSAPPRTR